jgi:hypothetical protein
LKSTHPGWYWEVLDPNHGDHRIWPQSQYLLYLAFKRFGRYDLAYEIYLANDFKVCAVDRVIYASSRFCVLDNDVPPFYLANQTALPSNYDEVALLGHYRFLTGASVKSIEYAGFLKSKLDPKLGIIGMDEGDRRRNLFRLYKTALAGTLFGRVGWIQDCQSIARKLESLQASDGGWVTDLDSSGKLNGVSNIETTCLALLCLDCASKGRF